MTDAIDQANAIGVLSRTVQEQQQLIEKLVAYGFAAETEARLYRDTIVRIANGRPCAARIIARNAMRGVEKR